MSGSSGTTSEATFVGSLPSRDQTAVSVGISKTLSTLSPKEEFLGEIRQQWLYTGPALRVLEGLRGRLKEVEATIDSRNVERPQELKYIHLKPSRIPSSIAI